MCEATTKYYNPHFVTVLSGLATKMQVARILLSGISQARSKTGIDFNTDIRINILIDNDGKYRGYGYLWFDDVRLANVFLGKNPDGTERVERYLPKNRIKLYKKLEKEIDELDMESWADLTEAEERIREKMESLYVTRKLDPLITLDEYGYNPNDVKEKLIYQPTEGRNIILGRLQFFLDPVSEKEEFERNMLFCSRVPDWVTEEDIYKVFHRYVTDKQARWVDPDGHRGNYPIVYINSTRDRRTATVVFENSPHCDALFAAKMERKANIPNPNTGKNETLIFTLKRK